MGLEEKNRWYSLSIEEVFERLGSREKGLTTEEAQGRLKDQGPNELEEGKGATWPEILISQIKNPIIIVLAVAAVISLLAEKRIDAAVIFAVIVLNTALGFLKEFKAEKAISALMSHAAPEADVLRIEGDGGESKKVRIKAREIVIGDVVLVEAGSKVPADARIVEAANLEIDESMLTGESVPAKKCVDSEVCRNPPPEGTISGIEIDNTIFAGTIVTRGRGKAVVFSTGMATEMGKIADMLTKTKSPATPLKKRTLDLGRKIMFLAILAGSLTFSITYYRGFELIDAFLFTLAMTVSAIPAALPAAITVALAVGVTRMAKRHAIMRKLDAVETLGSVTAICTDKTGTLTTNQMTVQRIFLGDRIVSVTGAGFKPEGRFEVDGSEMDPKEDEGLATFLRIAALCNDSSLRLKEGEDGKRWEIQGDPTEGALVVAAAKAGLPKEDLEDAYPRIDEIPFDPDKRYMATFHESGSGVEVCLKGAPETVLGICSAVQVDGEIRDLGEMDKEKILDMGSQMAADALRVLGFASKTIRKEEVAGFKEAGPSGLIFSGLSGMMDPPRPEAIEAIALAKKAGIKIVMATGDHKITAEAIAREMGIVEGESKAYSGSDLDGMDDSELDAAMEDAAVFARVSPEHKHRIVESLRRKGHIVAMTGDGVNDAPALKVAEIGIAMGITGTDVTKETADMVLTDDNFQSIVNAVEEGRVIFQNIRKVVRYLINTSAGEVLAITASLLFLALNVLIFTPVQILWVNLVTDGILVVNLAMEPKESDVMDQPPRDPGEKIINRDMVMNTLFIAFIMATGTLFVFMQEWNNGDLVRAQTMGFITMAMFQVFNALNCRSMTQSVFTLGLFSNRNLMIAIFASIALQILATELSFFNMALGSVSLSAADWATIIAVSSTVLIADEIRKAIRRRRMARA
ncbi:cation-translocating P-type ATPase [Candidatus Methanocrinis natronophilus]|uniref:HAD-IC family P-type ATPase n=1 Tax=Candidatus Methanocrinis natronophilus TaxID=3033396 RepID=A0ABT5X8M5_9EURY|nr:HAD-IC family P-type ATPase [Candidatus Methanocrinis natronophilus]MDF0591061.1 HAD-IC family P-type ATPase [Candidatus Methanocrinis natronophilus]